MGGKSSSCPNMEPESRMGLESWGTWLGPYPLGFPAAWAPMSAAVISSADTVLHESHFERVSDSRPPRPSFLIRSFMSGCSARPRSSLLPFVCRGVESPRSQRVSVPT